MTKLKNVKAIIFDMDGVLLDSETVCDRTWKMAFKELDMECNPAVLKACIGCNKTDSARIIREHLGDDFDSEKFLERTSYFFHKIEQDEGIPLKPYVTEVLEYLSKKYVLALASSTREESVRRELSNAGIIKYFNSLTCGDMVTHSKPDPQIYSMACNSIGMSPQNCIAIEDSYNGVKSAVAAEIPAIMVPDKLPPNEEMHKITTAICSDLKVMIQTLGL